MVIAEIQTSWEIIQSNVVITEIQTSWAIIQSNTVRDSDIMSNNPVKNGNRLKHHQQ